MQAWSESEGEWKDHQRDKCCGGDGPISTHHIAEHAVEDWRNRTGANRPCVEQRESSLRTMMWRRQLWYRPVQD